MKKFLLSSALIAISLFSFSQTAVPNGDFENWEESSCSTQLPTGYASSSSMIFEKYDVCSSEAGITKSTNNYTGTYALQISALNSGQISGNLINLGNSEESVGVAFTSRPSKLIGYTKFNRGASDTLGIWVYIIDANEEIVAYGELTISAAQSDYTKFEIPLEYMQQNTSEPVLLALGFGIGDIDKSASSSSVALIDALSFEYANVTSTVNYSATSPITVFAANNTINFSENVSDVHVVNMVGASKIQEAASTKTVNAAALNSGLYIATYNYNGNYFSKKVVIE